MVCYQMKNNDPHFQRLFDSAAQADSRERCIEAYRRLSATIDARLDRGVDADLAQLAIGCALARFGVDLSDRPPETMH